MSANPLQDIIVVEVGRRVACGAAGSFLAQLGASVFVVETDAAPDASFEDKFSQRDVFAYGKNSLRWSGEAGDPALQKLIEVADVIITSSDADLKALPVKPPAAAIVCDITAFGAGEGGGKPVSDFLLQAMSGMVDTTGDSSGPPVAIGAPVVELSSALYAAASIVAALRVRRLSGTAQAVDMSLYDCAVNAMATFLPSHFGGGKPRRLGNRHSMAAPWNAYRASDGTKLWSFFAQNGILSAPISYLVDGVQYVTVLASFRSSFANTPNWDYRQQHRRVLTFRLGGTASLPKFEPVTEEIADDPAFVIDPKKAAIGAAIYNTSCVICHGGGMIAGGAAPDLRKSAVPLDKDAFYSIVHEGALMDRGMGRFANLSDAELEGLRHYIRQRARETAPKK